MPYSLHVSQPTLKLRSCNYPLESAYELVSHFLHFFSLFGIRHPVLTIKKLLEWQEATSHLD